MADKTSYIRIDRNIKRWRWWSDHNTLVVFLTLLLDANISEHGFSGIKIQRGQVATSLPSLCNSTGLTKMQIRTALQHLKSTGEITSKVYSKFQVITISNYDKYQDLTGKTAYKQQADNIHLTGKQHQLEKKEKKEKERRIYSVPEIHFPCGTAEKPTWMTDAEWEECKMKNTDDIPDVERGYYDTYIEYAEEKHRGAVG